MSAYLKFFALERSPFDDDQSSKVVLGTRALREAMASIQAGLADGVARICVSAGPGMGKTSLARALPKLLGDEARVAVVLDPGVPWDSLRDDVARQWGRESGGLARANLLDAARERRLVLVVDQAERATTDFLDHLDIVLSYRTPDDRPVVQSVLLANLSTRDRRQPTALIWWLDRIHTLQLEFAPLPRDGVAPYIEKHLKRAGWRGEQLFTREAALAIHEFSGGIPGEVGRLCERLLAEAAAQQLSTIDADFVCAVCDAREAATQVPVTARGGSWSIDVTEELYDFDDDEPEEAWDESHEDAETRAGLDEGARGERAARRAAELDPPVRGSDPPARTVPATGAAPPGTHDAGAVAAPDARASDPLEDELRRPPTAEELRALLGHGWARYARTVVALAVALVVIGLGLGLLLGGGDADRPATRGGAGGAVGSETPSGPAISAADPGSGAARSDAGTTGASPVLARLRGPVLAEPTDEDGSGKATREDEDPSSLRPAEQDASTGEAAAKDAGARTSAPFD